MPLKKRIVFLAGTHGDWGGASRVLFNTLRMLDRERFEPIVLISQDGPAVALLDSLGIEHRIWTKLPEPADGLARYAWAVLSAIRMLRNLKAEILDINFNFWRPAEVFAAYLLRIPIVTHFHLVVPDPGPFVRFSSAVTVVSEFAKRGSSSSGRPMEVIPNTVVLERFDKAVSLRDQIGIVQSDIVVSFVGQIRENKGVDCFLRMAHALDEPNLKFLIAGECRDQRRYEGSYDLERLNREIGGDARISYLGYRTDVENIFRSSDILVVPSRWGEPFGLINIEAGAVGIPVVATRDGGIPEVIREGENGFLVEVGDQAGLEAAVRRLVKSPELRSAVGRRGRQIVEEYFTTAPVRRLERLYADVCAR